SAGKSVPQGGPGGAPSGLIGPGTSDGDGAHGIGSDGMRAAPIGLGRCCARTAAVWPSQAANSATVRYHFFIEATPIPQRLQSSGRWTNGRVRAAPAYLESAIESFHLK